MKKLDYEKSAKLIGGEIDGVDCFFAPVKFLLGLGHPSSLYELAVIKYCWDN